MAVAYLGVGSNIDPETNIPAALRLLRQRVRVTAVSTFYRTEPIGNRDAASFVNGVFQIQTDIPARELKFGVLRAVEEALGRRRAADKYASRTIDLDILVYGELAIREPGLVIPDPDIADRVFLAAPLYELAPGLVLPDSGLALEEVVTRLPAGGMVPLPDFTRRLRMEIANEP